MIILSVFAFTATPLIEDRTISMEREYKLKLSRNDIENVLKNNEKIINLKIERETDFYRDTNSPDVKVIRMVFFVDFSLKQQICDSKFPKFSLHIQHEKEFTIIKPYFVHFKCKEESMKPNANSATKRYEQELTEIFEREVIKTLKQNNSQ